jgi:deoxyribodipyrimidine photo-lyase
MNPRASTGQVDPRRVEPRNRKGLQRGDYVLYWMQASQRAQSNPALEYACLQANRLDLPLLVAFVLIDHYPQAALGPYAFMLQGICETARTLQKRGVGFVMRRGRPLEVVTALARRAAMVVADRGYLRHQRLWRRRLARRVGCRMVQVEADVVVPTALASRKREYAARTLRAKIHKHLDAFLTAWPSVDPDRRGDKLDVEGLEVSDGLKILRRMNVLPRPGRNRIYEAGTSQARGRLGAFIRHKLPEYHIRRNDPALDIQSHLSAYLHFGQISPVEVALAVRDSSAPAEAREAFLEELIVRRELAINFVRYTPNYDSYQALPSWARASLEKHKPDRREYVYTAEEIENARTHDPYFNAAMREMRLTGKMHTYMRMYWGKKILEWTNTPRFAHRLALELNNRWFLDGRDPLSYANVGWVFGLHDRPWQEREIFGQVRYMNAAGLERKFQIDRYVQGVAALGGAD